MRPLPRPSPKKGGEFRTAAGDLPKENGNDGFKAAAEAMRRAGKDAGQCRVVPSPHRGRTHFMSHTVLPLIRWVSIE